MNHKKYMQRCLELAKNGLGTTYPNPMVGSVIVFENKIIGEGWHQKAGEPHAEVNAINSVKDKSLLSKSTIYVSLEPCSHFGKTPPCSDLIIHHKIPNVVVGTVDPNEKVAGKGIEKLRNSGASVIVGILEKQCLELNRRFFTFHNQKRPFIILKWAESADGFLSPQTKNEQKPVWITNSYSRQLVHKWRTEEQAILVGTNTVLADNPQLNSRDWQGNNPIRIVLDRSGKIPNDYEVKNGKQSTIFITEKENFVSVENCNFETIIFDNQLAEKISSLLFQKGIQSVIIEGGLQTLQTFIDANLWDEARIFKGSLLFQQGTKAPILVGETVKRTTILNDELLILKRYD
ncbi:MAG TPA: bifunctional diaminohydroxyphosphoribosylaminopyrimidine deaminase/5-amino-6-(5-phosphoribosylamino)uracil reductase RibD [Flavobacterium sp.]|uniref:bifunctional diaminohydroxyphosphoribosylaminopyrimidine deaminase/5-amino-6-(5-phosphoribosylamino)uracil reductase RibD n=1 Tax=unclassified Flavobacterium TaxID=196869 RepID=UPI000E8ACC39|nr:MULTISPECIES: bifunctional diaminohydroxyphosphoribosylaminopyrimidine deaminase/5-amino-6-(5-phosphoribosylamino)uracil reductase RibD [unclassified Flavobacterium]HBI00131.1 bifunctional diaminohydroxyphosphoribosylaminopyrimidine deaminase/5-amino-6-(5-phosphoribosylamino)uracil reductase RibD [Flavobacterium sp.]HRE77298.1 bifunctional diaminohydroxyphosphoribosylaminopyrimidine deaminase/5-amino-6-(5-phosphoribosylamino)uracil reductase RibD [Flavobacterium sp.]